MIAPITSDYTPPKTRRLNVDLIVIVLVAAVVTVWWQAHNHLQFNADSISYVENAQRLSFLGRGYHCYRGPGYPLLIALTGVPLLNTFVILRIVQALMSIGIVVLIYAMLRPFSRAAAICAAALAIVVPIPWAYSTMVMTEQLYLFVLFLFFYLASRCLDASEPHRLRYFYAATLTMFELTLIKSSAAAFFVLWLALAAMTLRRPRHLAYAAAIYCALMVGWSVIDNIALSRGAKVSAMSSLAKTEFAEAYHSGWMKVFRHYEGEPTFITAERGPASRELFDLMSLYVEESPGNWVTLTPHARWGAHANNPSRLADELFSNPCQSYCEFIVRTVHARLGRKTANALLHRVASEYVPTGIPRILANTSFGVPTRYSGQVLFHHAYNYRDARIVSLDNGPATRQLVEAAKRHFTIEEQRWQDVFNTSAGGSSQAARSPLTVATLVDEMFSRPKESYWVLMWSASLEFYGLEGSDKLLRDVAIEAFTKHPSALNYATRTWTMFLGLEPDGPTRDWAHLEPFPYLNSHTDWLDAPLQAEVQGQRAVLPVLEASYGAAHMLKTWAFTLSVLAVPLMYRKRPLFWLTLTIVLISLAHCAICSCFSNYSSRNFDPALLPLLVVVAAGGGEVTNRIFNFRRSPGHMNDAFLNSRFISSQRSTVEVLNVSDHLATNDFPTGSSPDLFDLTVFIACYNEEANIIDTLDTLIEALNECNLSWEIVVIDDGSRDCSAQLVHDYMGTHPECAITLKVNGANKGLAQNYIEGAFLGRGKYYRLVCGDNVEPKETFVKIFKQIGAADMLIPYHVVCPGRSRGRVVLSRVFTKLVNFITGYRLHYYNGMAVLMRYQVMRWHTNYHGFGFQADMVTRLLDQGFSWIEIPVAGQERAHGSSKALTLKNLLSVSHMFLDLMIRRIAKIMYPPPRRRIPDYIVSNVEVVGNAESGAEITTHRAREVAA